MHELCHAQMPHTSTVVEDNAFCDTWTSHATHGWVVPCMHASCHAEMRHMNESHDMIESRDMCLQTSHVTFVYKCLQMRHCLRTSHATQTSLVAFDSDLVHMCVTSHFINEGFKALAVHDLLARIHVLIRTCATHTYTRHESWHTHNIIQHKSYIIRSIPCPHSCIHPHLRDTHKTTMWVAVNM